MQYEAPAAKESRFRVLGGRLWDVRAKEETQAGFWHGLQFSDVGDGLFPGLGEPRKPQTPKP